MTVSEATRQRLAPARPAPLVVPLLLVRASALARRLLAVLPHPRRTPFTFGYLTVLLGTTIALYLVSDSTAHALLLGSSTNLVELGSHPLRVLVASGLWLPGQDWVYYAIALTVALAPLERRMGAWRALAIVAFGHVGISLVTEGGVGLGILLHRLPVSEAHQMDVGASYVLMTAIGAAIGLLPAVVRWPVLAVAGYWLAVSPALDGGFDMTDTGHLLCLLTGVVCWLWLRRRGQLGTMWPVGPGRRWSRLAGDSRVDTDVPR
jgi:hypothetical protein